MFETSGGWSFLDMEGDSEDEEEESEEGDPEFQAESDGSEDAGASSEDYRSALFPAASVSLLYGLEDCTMHQIQSRTMVQHFNLMSVSLPRQSACTLVRLQHRGSWQVSEHSLHICVNKA